MLVMGTTIGVLLVLVPAAVLPVVLLSEGPTDGGAVAVVVGLLACGVYVVFDALRQTGRGSGLEEVARVNGLDLTNSTAARHYAGARFRSGERIVLHSLRTREHPVIEVGDTWSTARVRTRVSSMTNTVRAENAPSAEVFLRAVLSGPVRAPELLDGADDERGEARDMGAVPGLVPPDLDRALREFAGDYTLEVSGRELVLMGTQPWGPRRPERVRQSFALAEALAARVEETLVDGSAVQGGVPATVGTAPEETVRRGAHPLVVVLTVLALLITGPLAIALVLSGIDDLLRGEEGAARVVVSVIITAVMGLMALVVRWLTAPRRSRPRTVVEPSVRRRRRRRLLVAVPLALVAVFALLQWVILPLLSPGDPEAEMTSASQCPADDSGCQWRVSERVWAQRHGLSLPYSTDERNCEVTGPGRSVCPMYVTCEGGEAAIDAIYRGDPWEVVGVARSSAQGNQPVLTDPEEIEALVSEECD